MIKQKNNVKNVSRCFKCSKMFKKNYFTFYIFKERKYNLNVKNVKNIIICVKLCNYTNNCVIAQIIVNFNVIFSIYTKLLSK